MSYVDMIRLNLPLLIFTDELKFFLAYFHYTGGLNLITQSQSNYTHSFTQYTQYFTENTSYMKKNTGMYYCTGALHCTGTLDLEKNI